MLEKANYFGRPINGMLELCNNIFDRKIWLRADMISPPKQFDLWQFSAVGTVSGVKGIVDCDLLLDSSIIK